MKKFIVLDVETSKGKGASVYDLGYIITDSRGKIYEKQSLFILDTAMMKKDNSLELTEEIKKSHYAQKVQKYYLDGIMVNYWQAVTFSEAFERFNKSIETYKIKRVYAYNMAFDFRHLNNTCNELLHCDFFPDNVEIKCIWAYATNTICNNRNYFKWCEENNKVSNKGNVKTNAETVYGYIKNIPMFEEKHTGLEDCYIELEILLACKKKRTKEESTVSASCWRIPNEKYKMWRK